MADSAALDGGERIAVEVAGRAWTLAVRHQADAGDLYWNRLWPASVGLGEFLVAHADALGLRGQRVLELGCGTALVGLVAASLGAEVTCSDLAPEALALATINARLNGVRLAAAVPIDWCAPPPLERFPVVLGADVLYDEALVEPLTHTILTALAEGGTLLLSDAIRSPFNALLERFREVGLEHRQDLLDVRIDRRVHRVGVYSVRRRRPRRGRLSRAGRSRAE